MTAYIWNRTRSHYDRKDNKPMQPYGTVRLPICLNCGGFTLPAFDTQKAHCPKCGSENYIMVPEDEVADVQAEIRRKRTDTPDTKASIGHVPSTLEATDDGRILPPPQ